MKPRVLPFAAICLVSPPAISFARDPIGTGVYFVRLKTSQGVQATKFVHLGR